MSEGTTRKPPTTGGKKKFGSTGLPEAQGHGAKERKVGGFPPQKPLRATPKKAKANGGLEGEKALGKESRKNEEFTRTA